MADVDEQLRALNLRLARLEEAVLNLACGAVDDHQP